MSFKVNALFAHCMMCSENRSRLVSGERDGELVRNNINKGQFTLIGQ